MRDLEILKEQTPTFLQIARNGKSYICPNCGSGSGKHGSGITQNPNNPTQYKCWACGLQGDVIDLYGAYAGITEPKAMIEGCFNYYGIEEGYKITQKEPITPHQEKPQTDYTTFYTEAEKNNDYKYLQGRGISKEIQKRFHVGFVPAWVSPQAVQTTVEKGGNPANIPTSPRCIIPRSKFNYLARDTREDLTEEQKKYSKQNTGKTVLFNMDALKEEVVFIVEGEIDCMSIYEAGGNACGLCSTSNVKALLKHLKENRVLSRFVLMLDNDEAGQKATKELSEGLEELEIPFIVAEYDSKDPNTYLMNDPESMKQAVFSLQAEVLQVARIQQSGKYNAGEMLEYFRHIEEQPEGIEVKTGFRNLDREDRNLYGGLHEGLYIIGAVSSLGKTTFCLQLADQIAGNGQDVIFFSLEQSRYELMSKSISRHSYKNVRNTKDKAGHFMARETNQVLNNRRYKFYTPEEKKIIADAIESYQVEAENLYIYEGRYKGERLTVEHIKDIVKDHVENTGRTPVVFVDYLQILGTPVDFRGTDKQATDQAVTELKELSRNYKTVVFAISSFNRENYNNAVTMSSFKESGAIEYSSDVLFGLQYEGMSRIPEESDKEYMKRINELRIQNDSKKANKEPIMIELKCLKNRNGNIFSSMFYFINAFNYYEELYFDSDGFTNATGKTPFDKPAKVL